MVTYTEFTTDLGVEYILRNNGNNTVSWIPKDESNPDYQAYLNKDKPEQSTPIDTGDE
jgi:hypothetical protein